MVFFIYLLHRDFYFLDISRLNNPPTPTPKKLKHKQNKNKNKNRRKDTEGELFTEIPTGYQALGA